MKIVLVHPAIMDYRVELFEKLHKKYDVTFVLTKQGRGQENVKEIHEKISTEWKSKILNSNVIFCKKDIGMYLLLMKELVFGNYDIVITSTSRYVCWIASKLSGKKFIFMTEFWCLKDTSSARKILNSLTKMIMRHSDSIFAMGTKVSRSCIDFGVKTERIFMYPQCSVDYSKQSVKDLRKELKLNDKKIILFMGRLVKIKGLNFLMESFSMLEKTNENVFLLICGDGPDKDELENLAKQLKIKNILFTGTIEKKEISSYYNVCDIFVLPSIFYGPFYEPWGLVINEAMAFGKPIITTIAVGAGTDLVINGYNGYVVSDKNITELKLSLYKIISNTEKIKTFGINSRKLFLEKNNYSKMFLTFVAAIDYVAYNIENKR